LDFSTASEHAIELATAVARCDHSLITALHVIEPGTSSVAHAAGNAEPEASVERVRSEIAARFGEARGANIDVKVVVEEGRPVDCILECAAATGSDVIVLGTHGLSGFQRLVLGSVTEKVLRRASCPVLTVPPRSHAASHVPFRHVLCPVDFSEASLAALAFASSLADTSGAALTLMHVISWPWDEPPAPSLVELGTDQAAALLEFRRYCEVTAAARLQALAPGSSRGPQLPEARICHGKAHAEIVRVAAETQSDLIVMGVAGRRPLDLALLGSTTNQVVRQAPCPVLTVRENLRRSS
jgi:nucleotide-binding universal stress UspA family protein